MSQLSAAEAGTITAKSASFADVSAAVNQAQNGDTVQIPAGTATWNNHLEVNKDIALIGAGIDATVINDNIAKSEDPNSTVIGITLGSGTTPRLSGMTINGANGSGGLHNHGHVRVYGATKAFRVDHIKFTNQQTCAILCGGEVWGVIDHCEFHKSFKNGVIVQHDSWGGSQYGDGSWAEQLYLGTEKAVYVEDCDSYETANPVGFINDSEDGGRMVIRYCRLHNDGVQGHGTDSSQRRRGMRSFEIYNNTFEFSGGLFAAIYLRSGTGVIFNNTFKQTNTTTPYLPASGYDNMVVLANFRDSQAYTPWGQANGSSPYDQNSPGQNGYRAVDQCGSGTSRPLGGLGTPTPTWVGNQLDPIYQWGNNFGGNKSPVITSQSGKIQLNRDFYNNTPRPGYTPYVYPHPLVSGSAPPPPSTSPSPSASPSPTSSPDPSPSASPSATPTPTPVVTVLTPPSNLRLVDNSDTSSGNILSNGVFDLFGTNSIATDWGIMASTLTYTAAQDTGRNGDPCQRVTITTPGGWGLFLFQRPTLVLGKTYTWTFWYKTSGTNGVSAQIANDPLTAVILNERLPDSTVWRQYTKTFTYNDSQADDVRLLSDDAGSFWVDDMTLVAQ